ncbi:hypothetical protein BDZ94DRAFT_1315978 [Collybia nuda]|uniref:F-box domain-containing protein n=1 Tax=Collybia nuda TaxID=64659 RepID=A0A9P5XS01_9AGAR|nr:hypothetical protein BDZ94DRAFT_1315978 [Collybia nuda]
MSFHDHDSAPSEAVWSRLPMELMREIILYVASTNGRSARELRLVSRYVNIWVLPLLFRTLVLTTPEHITRFAATLLPKRKFHIPALKSTLHTFPRPLSSYTIDSLALVVNSRLPSVETALASVAPAFTHLKTLVITGQNMSSNAYWLRQNPIHPQKMMILHFGSPQLVNFKEPIFQSVTHLYTSVLVGYRESSVEHLPNLTHLAAHTRIDLSEDFATRVAHLLLATLESLPNLYSFVFVLNSDEISDSRLSLWSRLLEGCLRDKRFILLPYFRHPRMEWEAMLADEHTVWNRAQVWRRVKSEDNFTQIQYHSDMLKAVRAEHATLPNKKYMEADWEVDLIEREGFYAMDADPTERREATLSMFL